jgi:CheY-like chemotaxis protein
MSAAPLKILVVDDEPPIRKLLRMGPSKQGYEVLEAPNGKTALDLLAENPALVVLDLGLPDIQGLELLRMIRGRNEGVPIVVLSSRGDEVGKVEVLDLGADDYAPSRSAWTSCWRGCGRRCATSCRCTASGRSFEPASCRSTWCGASSRCATRR